CCAQWKKKPRSQNEFHPGALLRWSCYSQRPCKPPSRNSDSSTRQGFPVISNFSCPFLLLLSLHAGAECEATRENISANLGVVIRCLPLAILPAALRRSATSFAC